MMEIEQHARDLDHVGKANLRQAGRNADARRFENRATMIEFKQAQDEFVPIQR